MDDLSKLEEPIPPRPDGPPSSSDAPAGRRVSRTTRRELLRYALGGVACASLGTVAYWSATHRAKPVSSAEIFAGDCPDPEFWKEWERRGWVREARHYRKLDGSVQCRLCPNGCVLEPGDRGHCRNRVNRDGTLYTLAYGNPCAFHVDPIEKKPLFHFLPGTGAFSLATTGCGFRCLNCQNWDISQRKPEESKSIAGPSIRLNPRTLRGLAQIEVSQVSMFPDDVVDLAEHFRCPSIAYTYSEPIVWYEYMVDTAQRARQKRIKNVWITCGFIQSESLAELCKSIDAANVNLKSFDDSIYRELNTGKLQPVLDTLLALRREGVWFEVTNLIVPTYTDKPDMIRQMCHWLVDQLGPDQPVHFSRFHPAHKLTQLPATPVDILCEARDIARQAGLRYVYIGNVQGIADAETTFCPGCKKPVIERQLFTARPVNLVQGKCGSCGTAIAGVWSA